ncbi:NIPSNAP family protein [Pedobacter sp.]|uniref:NIPSNAP family protein n=1 Tax=Pedobacter sp. TaxID=1411316 RepID=UPI003D7FE9EB
MKFLIIPFRLMVCMIVLQSLLLPKSLSAQKLDRSIYQLVIYHINDKTQENRIDKYLSEAYLPALHRKGIPTVGVFKIANIDTAADRRIYMLIPYQSLQQYHELQKTLAKDGILTEKGADYINAKFDDAPYSRKEVVLMEAFSMMPRLKKPGLSGPKEQRIYELRSYESASEKLHQNKVQMFNDDEMEIFERIGSHPVFYGEVIAGSRMPNLMYMTAYSDKASRDAHWKTFGNDPKWKTISALPKYQNNMKRLDAIFLTPTSYSDF